MAAPKYKPGGKTIARGKIMARGKILAIGKIMARGTSGAVSVHLKTSCTKSKVIF
jgi:hypothetical protein